MAYAIDNALFQWQDGERRIRDADELEREDLEQAAEVVEDELRRRLGSSFTVEELADFYAGGVDWATDIAQLERAGTDSATVVDAAFARYARQATNFGGGEPRERPERPRD